MNTIFHTKVCAENMTDCNHSTWAEAEFAEFKTDHYYSFDFVQWGPSIIEVNAVFGQLQQSTAHTITSGNNTPISKKLLKQHLMVVAFVSFQMLQFPLPRLSSMFAQLHM